MNDADLFALAEDLGVATSYVDVHDQRHEASSTTLRAIVDLLLADRAAPSRVRGPVDEVVVVRGGRWSTGIAERFERPLRLTVLFDDGSSSEAVDADTADDIRRSMPGHTLPIGIHRLRWAVTGAGEQESTLLVAPAQFTGARSSRADLVLFAPVYALWTDEEPLPAYDTISRLGAATGALGVDTVATLPLYAPGFGDDFRSSPYSPISRFHWNELFVPDRLLGSPPHALPARTSSTLDWDLVVNARSRQLDEAVATMRADERRDLAVFLDERTDIASYARFCAGGDEQVARRLEFGQWSAERALQDVASALHDRGQRLALDLPVGARGDSWETHTWPHLFTRGASIGAPPDTFFAGGQSWGLPPLNPSASRSDGHRVWHALLEAACRYAGVLRIDHVMQVFRLWWVPEGHDPDQGAYVYYPADELLAVAAIVAERSDTVMVGENLGTVPPPVTRLLDDWGLIGMYEEGFALHDWAGARALSAREPALQPVPARAWAGIRTHDMPPLAVTAAELDLQHYCRALGASLGRSIGDEPDDLAGAMIERLRNDDAYAVVLDVDDALGVTAAHNVPGTTRPTNWTRRLPMSVGDLAGDARLRRTIAGPTSASGSGSRDTPDRKDG